VTSTLVIRAGLVFTGEREIEGGWVFVRDGMIAEVGSGDSPPADEVVTGIFPPPAGVGAAASLVTATVGIDGVAAAFADLANPERHTKIIVEPWR